MSSFEVAGRVFVLKPSKMIKHHLVLERMVSDDRGTISSLYRIKEGEKPEFLCFASENVKETRIPPGNYKIKLKREGKWAAYFMKTFEEPGCLQVVGEGCDDVLIRVGSKPEEGLPHILPSLAANYDSMSVYNSKPACAKLYRLVLDKKADKTMLTVVDLD